VKPPENDERQTSPERATDRCWSIALSGLAHCSHGSGGFTTGYHPLRFQRKNIFWKAIESLTD